MAIKIEASEAGDDVRANRYDVVSRLADDLAHEIKNPLNAIVVNLEVLRRRVVTGSPEAALERVDVVEHEIRRVHSLVDQVLQLLRPAKADTSPLAIDGILDSLESALQIQAHAAHVELECVSDGSLYAQIRGEPFKFALLNLITMAIDAESGAGGRVRIEARRGRDEVRVVVSCSKAVLNEEDRHVRFCGMLMESAGGALAPLERHEGGAGSAATLVMPPARFA
jgi:signal transduction histidine kinase